MQISLNIIDILCLHIFLLDPFEFPYYFYRINQFPPNTIKVIREFERGELI